jgi:hypothetical protein
MYFFTKRVLFANVLIKIHCVEPVNFSFRMKIFKYLFLLNVEEPEGLLSPSRLSLKKTLTK